MTKLFINIKELIQVRESKISFLSGKQMATLPTIKEAYLLIENDLIIDYGKMSDLKTNQVDEIIDCTGRMILPSWCDSHTHIVYAGNREKEFADKIKGLSYEEIAQKGGGILNSAKKLQETSEDVLFNQASKRIEEIISLGTGAVEIKSGYGLSLEGEIKMLRVIKKLQEIFPIEIKATFLGAHAFPIEFINDKEGYINLIIDEMLPQIAKENLADYVDAFCEKGYFSVEQTNRIIKAAKNFGLVPKIHVNQFNSIGGVKMSIDNKALSVDHLEVVNEQDITILKNSQTMSVALPACSFFIEIPYTPARKMIDAGLPLALATDYNPGSTPSGNMNFVIATACIKMKMTPEEAINAATINGAYAMGVNQTHGSISKGKQASFFITKEIPSYIFIPYSFGSNLVDKVYLQGQLIKK
jgi:imidazolonepropionase